MSQPEIEFEREAGGGAQLPMGAAAAANAAAPALSPDDPLQGIEEMSQSEEAIQDTTGLVPGIDYSDEDGPDYKPRDEEEEVLFGPSEGLGREMPEQPTARGPVPASVVRRLPALARAARRPDAPASVRAMYHTLLQRLENEMRNG